MRTPRPAPANHPRRREQSARGMLIAARLRLTLGLAAIFASACSRHASHETPPTEPAVVESTEPAPPSTRAVAVDPLAHPSGSPASDSAEVPPPSSDPVAPEVATDTASRTKAAARDRKMPRVNRPLDFAGLEAAIREKYQLNQLEDPEREFELLRARADAGDSEAVFALGLFLAYGEEGASDPTLAVEMFTRAAQAGVARAQTELGRLYLSGDGVSADSARAAQLFADAWRAGDPEGAFLLATGHRLSLFPASDAAQAESLLRAAAERGHVAAARTLYALTKSGEVTTPDPRLGSWLQAAAETGDASALLDLADLHLRARDGEKAFAAFETAAEAGSAVALWKLLSLSRTSLRDPANRARLQGMFELHAQSPGHASTVAFESLAFLQLYEPDRAAATARARDFFQQAADRESYRAKVAVQRLDRGIPLPEVLRDMASLSPEQAYTRSLELARETAPPTHPGSQTPHLQSLVEPTYPAELMADKISGEATVQFTVRADGTVTDLQVVSSSHPAFGPAAVAAIAQWKFGPGQKDGRAVNTTMRVPVKFRPAE